MNKLPPLFNDGTLATLDRLIQVSGHHAGV